MKNIEAGYVSVHKSLTTSCDTSSNHALRRSTSLIISKQGELWATYEYPPSCSLEWRTQKPVSFTKSKQWRNRLWMWVTVAQRAASKPLFLSEKCCSEEDAALLGQFWHKMSVITAIRRLWSCYGNIVLLLKQPNELRLSQISATTLLFEIIGKLRSKMLPNLVFAKTLK